MKKLLVLALAVVLTLSLTVVASAATFDPYVGGEFQLIYSEDLVNEDAPVTSINPPWSYGHGSHGRYKSYVTGTVKDEETNTWAKVGVLFKCWNESDPTHKAIYEAGIKGIADAIDIWYTNDENPNTKRGMVPLVQDPMKFGGDPGFSNGVEGDPIGIDYNSDNVTVNFIYDLNKASADADNLFAIAATIKFDGGSVWVGTRNYGANKLDQSGVGMTYGFGFGTLSVDYVTEKPDSGDAASYIQAGMNFTDLGLEAILLMDDGKFCGVDGGMGVGLTYNINDKFYVGGKLISPDTDGMEDSTEYYLGIKHGVLETRIGAGEMNTESYFYATVHAGLW